MTTDGANGCVEAVRDNEILGWVNNGPVPAGRLQTLQVTTDLGETATFSAHISRPEIADALGTPGKYGFALSRSILPRFSERVMLQNASGAPLRGGDVSLAPSQTTALAQARARWLVLHIPKTAGTSLRVYFERHFAPSEACWVYRRSDRHVTWPEFKTIGEAQRASFRIMMGHETSALSRDIPGDHGLVAFLREPIERMRSHILYRIRRHNGLMNVGDTWVPIAEAVNEAMTDGIDNAHTRYIAGVSKFNVPTLQRQHLQQAIETIEKRFDFVGRMENLEQDFPELTTMMALPPDTLPRYNVRPESADPADELVLASVDWPRVAERNALDIELYEWVRQHSHRINTRGRMAG